jgi:hypothetical protein
MILVTTAGKVGSETVHFLRQKAWSVRVLVRDPEKGKSLAEIGAEIVVGDLDSLPSIDQAMKGITTVVLVSPAIPAQELNVITSKASTDSPIARRRGQAEIENGLIASGLGYTLLCATTPTCRTSSCWHPPSPGRAASAPQRATVASA